MTPAADRRTAADQDLAWRPRFGLGRVSKCLSGSRLPASRLAALSSVAAQTQCDSLLGLASRARMSRSLIERHFDTRPSAVTANDGRVTSGSSAPDPARRTRESAWVWPSTEDNAAGRDAGAREPVKV